MDKRTTKTTTTATTAWQRKPVESSNEIRLDLLNTKCSAWGAYQLIAESQVVNLNMQAITVPWKREWKIIKALTAVSFEYKMDAWGVHELPLWSTSPRINIYRYFRPCLTNPYNPYVAMRNHSTIQSLPHCWWTLKYNHYNTTDESLKTFATKLLMNASTQLLQ